MNPIRRVLAPVLFLLAAACSSTNAPMIEQVQEPEMRMELNHLKWQDQVSADHFSAVSITDAGEVVLPRTPMSILADGDAVGLEKYQVSFWAEADEDETVKIYYASGLGYEHAFLEFRLDDESLYKRPDGSLIDDHDQVLITITIDPENLAVHLEPSGLQFRASEPASLKVWYDHANPDYNGDGVVDAADAAIEQSQFGMWVQQTANDPWYDVNAEQSLTSKWLRGYLQHFSGYAVSW